MRTLHILICFFPAFVLPMENAPYSLLTRKTICYIALGAILNVSIKKALHHFEPANVECWDKILHFTPLSNTSKVETRIGKNITTITSNILHKKDMLHKPSWYYLRLAILMPLETIATYIENMLEKIHARLSLIQALTHYRSYALCALPKIKSMCLDYILPLPTSPPWTRQRLHDHVGIINCIKNNKSERATIIRNAPDNWLKKDIYQTIHYTEQYKLAILPRATAQLIGDLATHCTMPLA